MKELKEKIRAIVEQTIAEKKKANGKVSLVIETQVWCSPREHGHFYVAEITRENGKIKRNFISGFKRIYDNEHYKYKVRWTFDGYEGMKLEARLSGSWKNDYRRYYIVRKGKLVGAERKEVLGI